MLYLLKMQSPRQTFNLERKKHWDAVAERLTSWKGLGGYYNQRVAQIYQFLIPPGSRVLEVGCGTGDLLASLKPAYGLGLDISEGMIELACSRHPEISFFPTDLIEYNHEETFDFILFSDTVNDLWDVQSALEKAHSLLSPSGRIILNFYSRLWEIPLKIAEALHLAKPNLLQNWLTIEDTNNLLHLADFETIRSWHEILLPLPIPLLAPLCNRFLVKLWPFRGLAMTQFIVARSRPAKTQTAKLPMVSVIVPARNESGNIKKIFDRVPNMGSSTELVFIEGHSRDNTAAEIEKQMKAHPNTNAQFAQQSGMGKGDAVRLGFAKARGDVLMILDADLTVPPEDLPRFYNALVTGKGEFINGVRLVYPMEKRAMRFLNFLGNKAFSIIFSWLLGQPVKDTLCGTKVMWKRDYETIAANRAYFGDFDPFGDFDLIFGAAKFNLKIVDLPIRYQERTYGTTNIQRWKHGWLLLKMVIFAARRLKFV